MSKYLIIGDDFTGSNDSGLQLARKGIETIVTISGDIHYDTSLVIDTETRGLSEKDSYKKINTMLSDLNWDRFDYVIKKVDSTLRGNIGSEIKALDDLNKFDLIVFAPAFPDLERITKDGVHIVDGKRILETEFAKDPVKPVLEDNIYKLMEKYFPGDVQHFTTADIRNKSYIYNRVITSDIESNKDMLDLIKLVTSEYKNVLWVGSAGISDGIISHELEIPPVVGLVTSVSEVAKAQVEFAKKEGVNVIALDSRRILKKDDMSDCVDKICSSLSSGRDTLIISDATLNKYKVSDTIEYGKTLGLERYDINKLLQDTSGQILRDALLSADVSGIYLSGGDTAIGFFEQIESSGTRVMSEVQIGIPLSHIVGGPFDNLKVVSKAGAFGEEDTLYYCFRKLKDV